MENNKLDKEIVRSSVLIDPEVLEDELNDMVQEASATLYLHAWGTHPIMKENRVRATL